MKIFISIICFFCLNHLSAQFPDDYLSYILEENWLKQRSIKSINSLFYSAHKKGKFRKKPFWELYYTDSLGVVGNEKSKEIIQYSDNHKEICQFFETGIKNCWEKFYSNGKLVRIKGSFNTYFHYNEFGKISSIWSCSNSMYNNEGDLAKFQYTDEGRLEKIATTVIRCPCKKDLTKNVSEYPIVKFQEEKFQYVGANLYMVTLFAGKNKNSLESFRRIQYVFDDENWPKEVYYYHLEEGSWILDSKKTFRYQK